MTSLKYVKYRKLFRAISQENGQVLPAPEDGVGYDTRLLDPNGKANC